MIGWCRANSYPDHGIGRSMKVDKETIAGLVAAVEIFVQRDYDDVYRHWDRMVVEIVEALAETDGLAVRRGFPTQPGIQPADIPRVYIEARDMSAEMLQKKLRESEPPVLAGVEGQELVLNPQTLEDDEVAPLIEAVAAAVSRGAERAA
jgi:L-seryl-tRNA(Ser) seleniumtransferase